MKPKETKEELRKTIEFPGGNNGETAVGKGRKALRRVTLGSFILIVFILLYIPSLINWLSGRRIARDLLRNGIIEEYIRCDAVIVRDEVLLEPSAIDGRCIAEIEEGEKTAAYSSVALITNDESDGIFQEIENINRKIIKARMGKLEKSEFFSEDLAKLDDEIAIKVQSLILACNSRSFEAIGRYRNEIAKIVEKKAEIIGENSTDSYINNLQKQKQVLQDKLNRNTLRIMSDISGIVSYTIDGYEKILNPKNIEKLSPEQLDKIIENDLRKEAAATVKVKAGSPVAKVIRGTDIYLAAAVPKEKAGIFKKGEKIKLRINNIGLETTGVIESVNGIENGDDSGNGGAAGRIVIVVGISRGMDVLSAVRVVNVDFIIKTEEGLKIPVKSLSDISKDGTKGRTMLVKYNVATSRIVDIVCMDDEYAIIRTPENEYKNTVNLYDIYIINPDNIKEGEIIEK